MSLQECLHDPFDPRVRFADGRCRCGCGETFGESTVAMRDTLAELERLTARADALTTAGSMKSAINAWGAVALLADRLLGRSDAAVIDAMRIIATLMNRIEMQDDAIRVLENAAERLVEAGWHRSGRGLAISEEMRAIRRSRRTTVLADSGLRPDRGGWPVPRMA